MNYLPLLLLATNALACQDADTYYAQVLKSTASGSAFKSLLGTRIASPYNRIPYTSTATDVWDVLEDIDAASASTVREIYTRDTPAKSDHTDWNREHLWPRSLGVGESGDDYSDVHHLYPSDWQVNSARSNKYFGFCNGCATGHNEAPLTKSNAARFEPPDEVKGDVARAIFYMATRYSYLTITDNPSSGNEMGYLSDLLAWHVQDPVSAAEKARNDKVCGYQLNRNPYVDHPCFVGRVFGTVYDCDGNNGNVPSGQPSDAPTPASDGDGEPVFTQYMEGSSYDKAVEITNRGSNPVSLGGYSIGVAYNGASTPGTSVSLTGTLAAGASLTVCHTSISNGAAPCSVYSNGLAMNGNDVVALYSGSTLVDAIGAPGTYGICGNTNAMTNNVLERKSFVMTGNRGSWSATSCDEWTVVDTWAARSGAQNQEPQVDAPVAMLPAIIGAAVGAAAIVVAGVIIVVRRRRADQDDRSGEVVSVSGKNDAFAEFRVNDESIL